jgi:hypothetical protein
MALHPEKTAKWHQLLKRARTQPTTLRVIRPLAVAAVTIAGACAVARMVQGSAYLSSRMVLGDALGGTLARGLAIGALLGVMYALGWRAVLHSLEHADKLSQRHGRSRAQAWLYGAWGSLLVLPLAAAALFEGAPLLSFFR